MKFLLTLACLTATLSAQEIGRLHFRENNSRQGSSTVVIDLTDPEVPAPPSLNRILEPGARSSGEPEPVQVSPSPSHDSAPVPEDPEPGLSVRVSGFTGKASKLDPDKISLKAPFPAKPLGSTPDGWMLVRADENVPIFESEAEVAPGSGLQLKVRPHLLVPAANGNTIFAVNEPGFDPALDYRQVETIGSLLGESVRRLEEDEKEMAEAIRRLDQLLISLPETAPAAPPAAAVPPAATTREP